MFSCLSYENNYFNNLKKNRITQTKSAIDIAINSLKEYEKKYLSSYHPYSFLCASMQNPLEGRDVALLIEQVAFETNDSIKKIIYKINHQAEDLSVYKTNLISLYEQKKHFFSQLQKNIKKWDIPIDNNPCQDLMDQCDRQIGIIKKQSEHSFQVMDMNEAKIEDKTLLKQSVDTYVRELKSFYESKVFSTTFNAHPLLKPQQVASHIKKTEDEINDFIIEINKQPDPFEFKKQIRSLLENKRKFFTLLQNTMSVKENSTWIDPNTQKSLYDKCQCQILMCDYQLMDSIPKFVHR